jgi:hypothetical protein
VCVYVCVHMRARKGGVFGVQHLSTEGDNKKLQGPRNELVNPRV